jgi:two-component system chemotaxis response regulator CheY
MRQMVVFTLKGAGYDVIEAIDGQDAFSKARTKPADVVLTNLNRPNLDGIQLIRELRKLPQHKFISMLLLTTESAGGKKTEGKAAGATGSLVTPFNPDQLLATRKKVLG